MKRYVEETGLPFNVLIDESRDVLKAYGVWHRAGLTAWNIARPAVFLIEPSGRIRYSFIAERQDEFPSNVELDAMIERVVKKDEGDGAKGRPEGGPTLRADS